MGYYVVHMRDIPQDPMQVVKFETLEDAHRNLMYRLSRLDRYRFGVTVSIEYVNDNRFIVVGYEDGEHTPPYYDDMQVRPIIEKEDWQMAGYYVISTRRDEASAERAMALLEKDQAKRDARNEARRKKASEDRWQKVLAAKEALRKAESDYHQEG